MKTFFKWLGNVLLILLIICAVLSMFSFIRSRKNLNTIPSIGQYKFMVVLSGSMSPTFNVYDMIVDKRVKTEELKKGDVITFWESNKILVTHRIVDIQSKDGKTAYRTRGDANNVTDDKLVDPSEVEGTYMFRIPYIGLVVSKLKGPIGLVVVWAVFMYVIFLEFFFKKKEKKTASEAQKSDNKNVSESSNN
jgi:signal peptidase I